VILLALVALAAAARRRLPPWLGKSVLVLWLLAVVAAITSMTPEVQVLGVSIPMPSHFITLVTSTWRVYSRFVMIVMLALSLLAAVGLDALVRRRSARSRIVVMSLATVLVPLDLWAPQHGHVAKLATPPGIYRTLARLPAGIVAEYPLAASGHNSYTDLYFQNIYKKPTIDGYLENTPEEMRAFWLSYLGAPYTVSGLATLGVRYVLVDATQPTPEEGWPPAGTPGVGLRLIASEPYAALYLVTARPTPVLATPGKDFISATVRPAGSIAALNGSSGTIELKGSCTRCDGVLSVAVEPYAQAREVTISDGHGHAVHASVRAPTKVSIPLSFARHTTLELAVTPEPQPVVGVLEGPRVGLLVSGLEFVAAGGADGRGAATGRRGDRAK
jgi:hypothetical protein